MRPVHGVVEHLDELHGERKHFGVVAQLLLGVDLAAELLDTAKLRLDTKIRLLILLGHTCSKDW